MAKNYLLTILIFLFSFQLYSNKLIKGTIIDCKTNLPLPGAQIFISDIESSKSTVTSDFNGLFEIETSVKVDQITISYPKYKEIKIKINDSGNLGQIILFKRGCKKTN